jgi:glycosyltransferase involved in cell wall biosynthesis
MLSYSFYESDTRILQYTSALVGRGDAVDVIALRRKGAPAFEVLGGVNVYRIQSRTVNEHSWFAHVVRILRFFFLSMCVLARKHCSKHYEVIHVHSVPDFLVFAAIIPKLFGARVILDIHDILPEFYASKFGVNRKSLLFELMLLVEKISIAFADHVIIANHLWQERLLSRSVTANKCTTILNYPDARIFQPHPKPHRDGKFLIVYPGSLNTHQGVDIAIRAFARVASQMPNAEFHIYGEGPCKPTLVRLVDELGLIGRVTFGDFLPSNEIAEVMARSDLAVVPKRASSAFGNEAASTKIMEFMSLGVPLIVSRTKVDTLYHDDSTMKFFESENESDLADSMLLLWRDPQIRAQLAANASRYVRENNWLEKKQGYLSLLDTMCFPAAARPAKANANVRA